MGLLLELVQHPSHVVLGAGQDQAPFELALAKLHLHPSPHHFFLENHENKADPAEENDDRAR